MATITGTALDDVLVTTATADVLTALNGNDVVLVANATHHAASENLAGGAGFDRLWLNGTAGQTYTLLAATSGFEAIQLADAAGNAASTLAVNLSAAALATGALLSGNAGANLITGSAKDDVLVGGLGADTLNGGAGNDRVVIDTTGTDTANAGAQTEGNTLVLVGAAPELVIVDLNVADQIVSFDVAADAAVQSGFSHLDATGLGAYGVRITATAGKNVFVGSSQSDAFVYNNSTHFSSDLVSGGLGDDVIRFASTTAAQTLTLGASVFGVERAEIADATGDVSGTTVLSLNASAMKYGMELAGNAGANTITGSAFDDTLSGNGGADSLAGGKGNDFYYFDDATDGEVGERIVDVAGTDYVLYGSSIAGSTLVLGATMTGVDGIYAVGFDSLGTSPNLADTMSRNVDGSNLNAIAAGYTFYGGAGANELRGSKGRDTIYGKAGEDSIYGGLGSDLIEMELDPTSVDQIDAGDAAEGNILRLTGAALGNAVIDLSVAADVDQVQFLNGSAEGIVQSDFAGVDASNMEDFGVTVTGSSGVNEVVGSGQDDVFVILNALDLNALDLFHGGGGNDTLRFQSTVAGTTLTVGAKVNVDDIQFAESDTMVGSTVLHLNAAGAKFAMRYTGNDAANSMTGSAYDDTLAGGLGADTLKGGLGSDEYRYNTAADAAVGERIEEAALDAEATDSIRFASSVNGEVLVLTTLMAGIEKVYLDEPEEDTILGASIGVDASVMAKGLSIFGNDGANTITGTAHADEIRGGKGLDQIVAGLKSDTVYINADVGHHDAANGSNGLVSSAAAYAELNMLKLENSEADVLVEVDLSVTYGADQSNLDGVQTGFAYVDGSGLLKGWVWVYGSDRADLMIGSNYNPDPEVLYDFFEPGLGKDTVHGGGGDDVIRVYTQAEMTGDQYNDNGGTLGDYIFFEGNAHGQTLTITDSVVNGWDVARAGSMFQDTLTGMDFDLNLNASGMTESFSLAGNGGRNVLTSTRNGESLFDWGGADTMYGQGGDDDYVIGANWVHGAMGVGDRIYDTGGTRDEMYNGTNAVITVNTTMVVGIERFAVSGTDLEVKGHDYVRDITFGNNGGFNLSAWNKATHLAGSYGNNELTGTNFNDTIIGHKGQDTIVGGKGNDHIHLDVSDGVVDAIDAGSFTTTEQNYLYLYVAGEGIGTGVVEVDLAAADQVVTIDENPEALVQTGFDHVDASKLKDWGAKIAGTASANTLVGSAFDDTIEGGDGADKVNAGAGFDAYVISDLTHYDSGDLFVGGADNDAVWFSSTLAGSTLTVAGDRLKEIEIAGIADDEGDTTGTVALNLNASTYANKLELFGNDGANLITGTKFGDTLNGNGGADTLRGGAGGDIYIVDTGSEVVAGDRIEDTLVGVDILRFTSETDGDMVVLTANMFGLDKVITSDKDGVTFEVLFNTGIDASAVAGKLLMEGNEGENTLIGTAFNDTIDGSLGHDTLDGSGGADVFLVQMDADDRDDVDGGDITDVGGNLIVISGDVGGATTWDFSVASSQLISIGGAAATNMVADLTGVDASAVGDAVIVTGGAQANVVIGSSSVDIFIVENAADFVINSNPALSERFDGRAGNDTLRFASTTDLEILVLNNLVENVEVVQLSNAAGVLTGTENIGVNAAAAKGAIKFEGNDGNNTITGTANADTIIGAGGTDSIVGGLGADRIVVQVSAGNVDTAIAGATTEGNELVLEGAAAGNAVMNLALAAGDQLTGAEALVQSGFTHFDASSMTGGNVTVTGSDLANSIAGTALADAITGGLGADVIKFNIGGGSDTINAGAVTEGNQLVLTGAAAGDVVVDLTVISGDQVLSIDGVGDATSQGGFQHLDAAAMTGASVSVTGSAAANSIVGTSQDDTIFGGAGADTISFNIAGSSDQIDAGAPTDGDLFVLTGSAADIVHLDFGVAAGADQLTAIGGATDATVQANFQHLDASKMTGSGVEFRGNGLNNSVKGSDSADTLLGREGADRFWLGGGDGVDSSVDSVLYAQVADGTKTAGLAFSFDRIHEFKAGQDKVSFIGDFNSGASNLDDILDNNSFGMVSNTKADFAALHEGLVIDEVKSGLKTEASLTASSFSSVVTAINKVGVVAAAGDDGLIAVQAKTTAGQYFTGVYYYQEMDGTVNKVSAGELTLLGVFDAQLTSGDFNFL